MKGDPDQPTLFSEDEYLLWRKEWKDMPEFVQEDLAPWKSLAVHFENEEDLIKFAQLVQQRITPDTRSIWFPEAEIGRMSNKRFTDEP